MNNVFARIMTKSWSMMDKPRSDKGVALIEMMVVLSLLSVFITGTLKPIRSFLYHDTQNQIVHTQTSVLFQRKALQLDLDEHIESFNGVGFNAKGNVNTAQTLAFENGREIVIQLGPGRIHE